MGIGQSQLIQKPNWQGIWSSITYGEAVNGTVDIALPDNISGDFKAEALVHYKTKSIFHISDRLFLQFNGNTTNNVTSSSEDNYAYSTSITVQLKATNTLFRTFEYTATTVDISNGKISGTYRSTIPSDCGTFHLEKILN